MRIFLASQTFKTEEQAKAFCKLKNSKSRYYQRVKPNAHYTQTPQGFVCYYYL